MSVIQSFQAGLKPIPRLKPSEWADAHRMLSSTSSSEPGHWKTSRTPYLKEIMDCFTPGSDVQEVVIMKGSQVGLTEAGFNIIGFYIDTDPCPMMYVMPTDGVVKRNSKIRFDPMVEASPNLRQKINPSRVRDKTNSMLEKAFPGGVLIFCGANSPAPLRSVPIRLVVLDEVDAMPTDVGGEGNPIDLARARTRTFPQKKVMIISTPTIEGASMIEQEYNSTDQRRYFVPCPECGLMQTLEFESLHWETIADVRYECCGCGHLIEERAKPKMLKLGEWRSTKPENKNARRVGYHLSGLYSPLGWLSWNEAVLQYENAGADAEKLKVFYNTVLGETYKEKGDAPEWDSLYSRRENYPTYRPPSKVVFLTAGCDVQKDRLELEIVGWCKDLQSYSIDYRVILGDTSSTGPGSVWETLGKLMQEQWQREDGRVLMIRRLAVDSGFNTSEVYNFCFSQDITRVSAVKGRESLNMAVAAPRPVTFKFNGKPIKFNALWTVGTSFLKAELYGKLKLKVNEDESFPPWYCHFPSAYEPYYFRMLTAEHLQKRIVRGFAVFEWVKSFARNEALDCRIYARAAMAMLGAERWSEAEWTAVEKSNDIGPGERPPRKSNKGQKSSFWNR
jgi:phage terminase large subunit GpA-like protein